MPRYAADTSVSSDKSQQEIQRTLRRYGADQFVYGWTDNSAMIGFALAGRQVRIWVPMPSRSEFAKTPTGRPRTANATDEAHEQAIRQRWRALALVVKAKLEAVDTGITTFDEEFLAHIVMPNGRTVADEVIPKMTAALAGESVPALMPAPGEKP
ncbi:hypothetical protein [Mycolicibacterium mageritense]|uniref:hypothetical protein n=1 Tax=Mycolicibacterium mageritense TaxID=53462 RepID=UPI001E3C9E48|nr:hypothetical protein [Mycolicibacterium mageritense]GJJ23707.1 hypothetical protein MTY414_73800 [Mycolicibacterium mageritense]